MLDISSGGFSAVKIECAKVQQIELAIFIKSLLSATTMSQTVQLQSSGS